MRYKSEPDDYTPIKIELRITCIGAPLQIEGTIDDINIYYRERHARWCIEVSTDTIQWEWAEKSDSEEDIGEALKRIIAGWQNLLEIRRMAENNG